MGKGGGSNKVEETEDQREFARIAEEMNQDYETRWGPLLDRYIGDTLDPDAGQTAMNLSSAETARAFSEVAPEVATATARRGGRVEDALGSLAIDEGMSGGLNAVDTRQAVDDTRLANLGAISGVLRGDKSQAVRGLSSVANLSSQQARSDAVVSAQNRLGLQGAALTAAGLGANAYVNRQPSAADYAIGGRLGPELHPGI